MAQVSIAPPRLPEAPMDYNQQYMADLLRALEIFISQERTPGELRATKITLTDLPTSAAGLESGALYNDSGTVKVAP
jgi:hypothetical protein